MGAVRVSHATRIFGQSAESEAERFLRRKGYRILERNARSFYGELDLVAQSGDIVVFVEVKARRTPAFGGAPYAVDVKKRERLIRLAAHYLSRNRMRNRHCRFDVLLCRGGMGGTTAIEHIENAFEVPGGELQW
jgi:putative endonuclease